MRQLGELQTAIMNTLWTRVEPVSVREVLNELSRTRPLAYTTVMTVMDTLYHKGMVTRSRQGRGYVYRAAKSKAEHTAEMLAEVLGETDQPAAALLRFVERMDPADVAEFRRVLDAAGED